MDERTQHFSKSVFSKKEDSEQKQGNQVNSLPHKQTPVTSSGSYKDLKKKIHTKLLDELDTTKLGEDLSDEATKQNITTLIETLLAEESVPIGMQDRKKLIQELIDDILGLGPIEPLLRDTTVNDVLVNGPKNVYVERKGVLEKTNITFDDEGHLMKTINRIVSCVGRRVDESSPMVDARLKDGSRIKAIFLPPGRRFCRKFRFLFLVELFLI